MLRIYDNKRKVNNDVCQYILNSQNEYIKKRICSMEKNNKTVKFNFNPQIISHSNENSQLHSLDFFLFASLFFLSTMSSYFYTFVAKLIK